MKVRLCCAILVLFLFSGICFAQVPASPLPAPSSDISVSFIFAAKDRSVFDNGFGGQFTMSHFVNDKVGFQVEGDYLKMDFQNLRDAGGRVGPVVRFWTNHAVQPYVHALIGYAAVKSTYLNPVTSFNGAPSVMAGGGLDFPLSGEWHGRFGADLENDWTAIQTRVVRGVAGISYQFGYK